MNICKKMTLSLALSLLMSVLVVGRSYAIGWPVIDASTIGTAITNGIKIITETKTNAEGKRIAGKMNNTIGGAIFDPSKFFEQDALKSKKEPEPDYGED